jgi:hypothetical protein
MSGVGTGAFGKRSDFRVVEKRNGQSRHVPLSIAELDQIAAYVHAGERQDNCILIVVVVVNESECVTILLLVVDDRLHGHVSAHNDGGKPADAGPPFLRSPSYEPIVTEIV